MSEETPRKKCLDHLHRAAQIVASWPKWKQEVARQIMAPIVPMQYNSETDTCEEKSPNVGSA